MGKTSIEWTQETWLRDLHGAKLENQRIDKSPGHSSPRPRDPFVDVSVSLGTVARSARRHDVPWPALASVRDRNDMIPRVGRFFAVSADAAIILKSLRLRIQWDLFDAALTLRGKLDPTPPKGFIGGIPFAVVFPAANCTSSVLNSSGQLPIAATAAPQNSRTSHDLSLDRARTGTFPAFSTVNARRAESVAPGLIGAKPRLHHPTSTPAAPLFTGSRSPQIFCERNSELSGGDLRRSKP